MTKNKKPDYSAQNIPALMSFCEEFGLEFSWKNKAMGHAVVRGRGVELYVWVQRMVIEVRKRNGVQLSQGDWVRGSYEFNKAQFKALVSLSDEPKEQSGMRGRLKPKWRKGVAVVRIPAGTPSAERERALAELHQLAKSHSRTRPDW